MEGICCVYSEWQEKMQRSQERKVEESILLEVCITQVNSSSAVIQPGALYLEKMVTNDLLYRSKLLAKKCM